MINKLKQYAALLWEKGLAHIFAGSFLTKFIAFFGSILLVRSLSKFDLGVLSYLENKYGYVWIFAGMGLSNAILRFVVLEDELAGKKRFFLYAIKTGLLFNLALVVLASGINLIYPHKSEYQPYAWLLFFLLGSLPFQYFTDSVLSHERAMFENRRYMAFSLLISVSIISGKIIFGKLFGVKGAVFSQAFTYVALGIILYCATSLKHYGKPLFFRVESIENKKEVNTYSAQYMITNGLWAVFMLNDIFLLGLYCSPEIVAEYRVAYTIPGCVSLISSSIGIFVAPYFVKYEKDLAWVRSNYKKTMLGTAGFVGLVCLMIALLTKPLILLLYGEQYLSVSSVMRLLLVAAFFNCGLRYTTANILAAMGQIRYNLIVSAIGTLLQVGINLLVIPRYASYGVAVTSCFVYLFMALSLFIVFYRRYLSQKA